MSKRNLCTGLIACAITLLSLGSAYRQHRQPPRQTFDAAVASVSANRAALSVAGPRQTGQAPLTYQQALMSTMALCDILAPTAGEVSFTADPSEVRTRDGACLRTWFVMCEDRKGDCIAHFVWDADTRDLIWMGSPLNQPHGWRLAHTSAEGVRTARWWLAALGVSPSRTPWQQVRATIRLGDAWIVRLRSPEKEAIVTVDVKSGSLNYLRCWHARRRGLTAPW